MEGANDIPAEVDRLFAEMAFARYVAAYDPRNPRIALKVEHTLRVAGLCERIARGIGLREGDVELAWLAGLLHDIGRFEQVRQYDTFNDAASTAHAALGVQVLFGGAGEGGPGAEALVASGLAVEGEPLIRAFSGNPANDEPLRKAVWLHSSLRLPKRLDERTLTLCRVLRDADKLDILEVNCTCPVADIYGVTEDAMRASELSPECVEIFYEHRCLPRGVRRHPADVLLGHICFAWELEFDESLQIAREQGHLDAMLRREWTNPATAETFSALAAHMRAALGM